MSTALLLTAHRAGGADAARPQPILPRVYWHSGPLGYAVTLAGTARARRHAVRAKHFARQHAGNAPTSGGRRAPAAAQPRRERAAAAVAKGRSTALCCAEFQLHRRMAFCFNVIRPARQGRCYPAGVGRSYQRMAWAIYHSPTGGGQGPGSPTPAKSIFSSAGRSASAINTQISPGEAFTVMETSHGPLNVDSGFSNVLERREAAPNVLAIFNPDACFQHAGDRAARLRLDTAALPASKRDSVATRLVGSYSLPLSTTGEDRTAGATAGDVVFAAHANTSWGFGLLPGLGDTPLRSAWLGAFYTLARWSAANGFATI